MKRWPILAAVLALLTGGPAARACQEGWSDYHTNTLIGLTVTMPIFSIADIVFVTHDLYLSSKHDRPTRGWAAAELLAGGAQLLTNLWFLGWTLKGENIPDYGVTSNVRPQALAIEAVQMAVGSALAIHGIWALKAGDKAAQRTFWIAPTGGSAVGVCAGGRF